jgi:hypothetical protein
MAEASTKPRSFTVGRRNEISAELAQRSQDAKEWIEKILQEKLQDGESLQGTLRDGTVLCRTMRKIKPESIKKFNEFKDKSLQSYKALENMYATSG